ncbi:MAG: hypothetical protein ABI852_10970 [Gemmatimonadaceae bacterium]
MNASDAQASTRPRRSSVSFLNRHIRRGATLVELIVALPIAAVVGLVAMSLLLDTNKLARRLNSTTEIARELRQAAAVLASEIRPLSATDIVAWTDTSLDMQALAGSGVACAAPASNIIDMLPLNGTDALRTSWFATPQAGDRVYTVGTDSAMVPVDGNWQSSVLSASSSAAASNCVGQPLLTMSSTPGTVVRLTLASAIPMKPSVGSSVRIMRRTRYSLYKASDGLWYLGRKTFNGLVWTTIQPVSGPFDKPVLKGLLIQVRDSASNVLPPGSLTSPRSIALTLHGSSPWLRAPGKPGAIDSVLMHVTLRGQMTVSVP